MPPETTENVAATSSGASASGNVTSGTASDAMIKAAMASASSAESSTSAKPAEAGAAPAQPAGDTAQPTGTSAPGATEPTKGAQAQPGPSGAPQTSGPVPADRHIAAVKNARGNGYKDAEKAYGIEGLQPDAVKLAVSVARDIAADPKSAAEMLAKSLGMRLVPLTAEGQSVPEGSATAFPKPRLRAEDGTEAYAADQLPQILDIFKRQLLETVGGQVQPLLKDRENAQRRDQEESVRQDARSIAAEALAEARKLQHFTKENEPAILEMLREIPAEHKQRIGVVAALYQAYNRFLSEHVFPTIDTAAEQRVRDSNARKVATSQGSGHPTDSGGDGKAPMLNNPESLAKHMERLAATDLSGRF